MALYFSYSPPPDDAAGFVKPDWLVPVSDMARDYPEAARRWQGYVPELLKHVEAMGGFQLDAIPELRKADEDRIRNPGLVFKDTRIKAANRGFLFMIISHYYPKQIYLNADGQFQDAGFDQCQAICE